MSTHTDKKVWHVASWPLLAWAETAVKGVALFIAIITFFQAWAVGNFSWPSGIRLAQFIVLGILSLGLLVAIVDRYLEREIIAILFVMLNNVGHWGVLLALTTNLASLPLLAFAGLMLLGDLIKLQFLRVHNFIVRDTPPAILYGLTTFYVIGYSVLLILDLFR